MNDPITDELLEKSLESASKTEYTLLSKKIAEEEFSPEYSGDFKEKMSLLIKAGNTPTVKKLTWRQRLFRSKPVAAAVILCITFSLIGLSAMAYELLRGDFFKQFYQKIANQDNEDLNYMDIDQLEEISGSTIGAVVDDDIIRVEIKDSIYSGNTLKFMMTLTVKNLPADVPEDTMLIPADIFFEDDDSTINSATTYYYQLDNPELEPNQVDMLCTASLNSDFKKDTIDVTIDQLVYPDSEEELGKTFSDKSWKFTIALDGKSDFSRKVILDKVIEHNNYSYHVVEFFVTPVSFTLDCTFEVEDAGTRINTADINFHMKDGSVMTDDNFSSYSVGSSDTEASVQVDLRVPINVNDIDAVEVFGEKIPLPALEQNE